MLKEKIVALKALLDEAWEERKEYLCESDGYAFQDVTSALDYLKEE